MKLPTETQEEHYALNKMEEWDSLSLSKYFEDNPPPIFKRMAKEIKADIDIRPIIHPDYVFLNTCHFRLMQHEVREIVQTIETGAWQEYCEHRRDPKWAKAKRLHRRSLMARDSQFTGTSIEAPLSPKAEAFEVRLKWAKHQLRIMDRGIFDKGKESWTPIRTDLVAQAARTSQEAAQLAGALTIEIQNIRRSSSRHVQNKPGLRDVLLSRWMVHGLFLKSDSEIASYMGETPELFGGVVPNPHKAQSFVDQREKNTALVKKARQDLGLHAGGCPL
jgi:hypothetical protein